MTIPFVTVTFVTQVRVSCNVKIGIIYMNISISLYPFCLFCPFVTQVRVLRSRTRERPAHTYERAWGLET